RRLSDVHVVVLERLGQRRDGDFRPLAQLAKAEGGMEALGPISTLQAGHQLREGEFRGAEESEVHERLLVAVRVRSHEPSVYRPEGGAVLRGVGGWGVLP